MTEQPELLAVITRKKTGKVVVVVKRGGPPVHISEVIPEALETLLPETQPA